MTNDCKKMKRALIVTALARFTKSFLTNDIITLQKMGYEVRCAAISITLGPNVCQHILKT